MTAVTSDDPLTMRRIFYLVHAEARRRALQFIAEAPEGWRVTVGPPKRSIGQNDKFHALCSDLEKSRHPWLGKPRKAAEWKVLLVSGHSVATKEGAEIVPGLEGEFVNIRESTARMSKARGSSLIEYTQAYCDVNDVPTGEFNELAEAKAA